MRDLAAHGGELYVVTGPVFEGQELKSIGPDGVLVPSSTWKAVYDPRAGGAGAYVCTNTASSSCAMVSVAVLTRMTGVDPLPAVPSSVKDIAMPLPPPQPSPYATGRHRRERRGEGLFD